MPSAKKSFIKQFLSTKNVAGIVPLLYNDRRYNNPWHDSLNLICPNYTFIEGAVYRCLLYGCNSIWIVCNSDVSPIIRQRIGEWVVDFRNVITYIKMKKGIVPAPAESFFTSIPVYYVPISSRYRDTRNCYTWSILSGAVMAHNICSSFSSRTAPNKYFVSPMYGIYNQKPLLQKRKWQSSLRKNMFAEYNGKTFLDGEYLPFTFDKNDLSLLKKTFTECSTNENYSHLKPAEKFSVDKVFSWYRMEDADRMRVQYYYDLSSWNGYKKFLGSEYSSFFQKRPFVFDVHHKSIILAGDKDNRKFEGINKLDEKEIFTNVDTTGYGNGEEVQFDSVLDEGASWTPGELDELVTRIEEDSGDNGDN